MQSLTSSGRMLVLLACLAVPSSINGALLWKQFQIERNFFLNLNGMQRQPAWATTTIANNWRNSRDNDRPSCFISIHLIDWRECCVIWLGKTLFHADFCDGVFQWKRKRVWIFIIHGRGWKSQCCFVSTKENNLKFDYSPSPSWTFD